MDSIRLAREMRQAQREAAYNKKMLISMLDYVRLVAEMRQAQRDYFKSRSPEALERAKNLERQVDEKTKFFLEPPLFS